MARESVQAQINREVTRFGSLLPATTIPVIPKPSADVASLQKSVLAIKTAIDAMLGAGSAADRAITVHDLVPPGQTTIQLPDYTFPGGAAGGGSGGGDLGYVDPRPVLSTPPTLTDFTATGAVENILLDWVRVDYRNHAFVEVWRHASDNLASATLLGTTVADVYVDSTAAYGVTYYYWARAALYRASDGAVVFGAYNAVSGTAASRALDVPLVLDELTGQIRDSHLYQALAAPIQRIGFNDDALAADTLSAAVAAHLDAKQRAAELLNEALERGTDIRTTQQLVNEGDAQLAQQITTLTATVQTNQSTALAAVESEALARANGDAAEAVQRDLLAVQLRGSYTGSDLNAVTSGFVAAERAARVGADNAQVSRLDALEASVDTPGTGLLARATSLESAVVDLNGDILVEAERVDTLEAAVNTPTVGNNPTYAALQTEAAARVALDGSVQALYTVRAEVAAGGRTVVGGFGLAATSTAAGGATIDFAVRADRFYVAPPSSTPVAEMMPFIVQAAPTTINGVAVPAGTYIADAFIRNGTITNAKIGNLAVDTAKIADAAITEAKIGDAQITNAKIADATITNAKIVSVLATQVTASSLAAITANLGTITAGNITLDTSGFIRGGATSYGSTGGFWLGYASGTYRLSIGDKLLFDGTNLTINGGGTFSGALSAATGTFAGILSAASGSFQGNLLAVSGTFNTITAGLLRNAADTSRLDLNASGSADFLSAGNGAARITADGDAFFTKVLATGTWYGDLELMDVFTDPETGPAYAPGSRVLEIDTGYSKSWNTLFQRTLTARVGQFTMLYNSPAEAPNSYVGTLQVEASAALRKPAFAAPVSVGSGNPYGAGLERAFVVLRIKLVDNDFKTSWRLTSIQWTLDTAG